MPPPFNPRSSVTASTAKQDLIRIKLEGWELEHSDDADRTTFLRSLNPETDALVFPFGTVAVPRQIFLLQQSQWMAWTRRLAIAAQNAGLRRLPDRPLFGGELTISSPRRNLDPDFARQSRVAFELNLNPTRFVRHQGQVTNVRNTVSLWEFAPPRLLTGPPIPLPEPTLDGNDNVLGSPLLERLANPVAWPVHLRRYWDALIYTLEALLTNAARTAQTRLHSHLTFNVWYAETYWEFSTSDALGLARSLSRHLLTFAANARGREYFSQERNENAVCVRIRLSGGLFLKVYAKTANRVRFEVEHRLTDSGVRIAGGHTGQSFGDFHRILSECANQAANEVNQVFRFLADYIPMVQSESAYRLLHRITSVLGNPETAERIVSILVHNDAISLRPNDPLQNAVTLLRSAGILWRTRNNGRTFRVAPTYVMAIAQLRGQARMRFPIG